MSTMQWERVAPPYYWAEIDDYVIADRHLPDGTRQHMVRGTVEPGRVVRNAQIIGHAESGISLRSAPLSSLSQPGAVTDELFRVDSESYVSRVSKMTMRRALAGEVSLTGNPIQGLWVLRKHTGELVDFNQYRNDLAEHNELTIAAPATGECRFTLPEFWDVLKLPDKQAIVFIAPAAAGAVWIDWSRRVYGAGTEPNSAVLSTNCYTGRNWKLKIQNDAIRWFLDNRA